MFGAMLSVPVPDLDRCEHLLVLGANPLVSNGSLMTSPNARGRIRAIRERGGKVVVIDPRRSRTAEEADEHHAIVPGTDAHFLFGIVHTLFDEGLADPGAMAGHCEGIDEVERLAADFAPERVAAHCGIEAGEIRRIARELAAAERGACYGRIGTCTQEFGTLASWLVDVVNVLTGNLDREGGAMFTRAAGAQRNTSGKPGAGKGIKLGRWTSRVRGLPEAFGELPVVCLAEEIETPGDGQVRALVTVAGNPVVSTPQSERLDRAPRGARLHGLARHLRQRDDAPCRRDPAGTVATRPLALRPRAVPARRAQRGELLAAGDGARAGARARVAPAPAADRDRDGPGRRRGPRRARLVRDRRADPAFGRRPAVEARGPRPRGGSRGARGPARARSRARPLPSLGPVRADAGRARGESARDRPRPARAAHPRGAAHALRQDRAGAGADRRRCASGCARHSSARATATSC